jgi:hypothetical protein
LRVWGNAQILIISTPYAIGKCDTILKVITGSRRLFMTLKQTTPKDVDNFIGATEEARKIILTDEDIKRINDLAHEAEIEENQNDSETGIAAKKPDDQSRSINI